MSSDRLMRGSSKPRAGWVLQCESLLQPENNLAGTHKVPCGCKQLEPAVCYESDQPFVP
jgi:hypothetical protein